jgi:hypothetical protein
VKPHGARSVARWSVETDVPLSEPERLLTADELAPILRMSLDLTIC